MRVTLLNDTRVEVNPGCHATMAGLTDLLRRVTGGEISTVPLGAAHDLFADLGATGAARSRDAWIDIVHRMDRHDPVVAAIESADLVVANLEGTFHHHTVGALALGGLMRLAHRRGVPVWAVNGTIEDIEPWLLHEALAPVRHLALREPVSTAWLRRQGVRASLAADCALLADVFEEPVPVSLPPRAALVTPGVLARMERSDRLDPGRYVGQVRELIRLGYAPVHLEIDDAEGWLTEQARDAGAHVIRASDVHWSRIGTLVRECDLVVSGRYHVLLFGAMAGVPIVPLRSNTWKIEALMAHLGLKSSPVSEAGELRRLHEGGVPVATPGALMRCRTLALRNATGVAGGRARQARRSRTTVIAPRGLRLSGSESPIHHVSWPGRSTDATVSLDRLASALMASRRQVVVAGLERLRPDLLTPSLRVLHEHVPTRLTVIVDGTPPADWYGAGGVARPVAAWRDVWRHAGFLVEHEECIEGPQSRTAAPAWNRARPWRDPDDEGARSFTLRRSPDRYPSEEQLRRTLGARHDEPGPKAMPARVVFAVGTYQEFRQFLPLWERLPPKSCRVLWRRAHEPGLLARQRMGLDWLRRRRVAVQVIDGCRDVDWRALVGRGPAAFVCGAESTAFESHVWTAALAIAARSSGLATVQLQHGIWPYADLERPMSWVSDEWLVWSHEFPRRCREVIAWGDAGPAPRAPVGSTQFTVTGCPLFDAYADCSAARLEDRLGRWTAPFRRRVLVATNLHWTKHHDGAAVTPAILALAARMPDTLFVLKPHPVHDPEPELLSACPPNVVVLDEACCLWLGIDSTWLVRACDAVLTTPSTMALEAALAGRPFLVIDTGNPNRYEHVEAVPLDRLPSALRDVLEGATQDAAQFVDHYFDRATLGGGVDAVLDAIRRAAIRGPQPLDASRSPVVLSRLAESVSTLGSFMEWARVELAARREASSTDDDPARFVAASDEALLAAPRSGRLQLALFGASAAGRQALTHARRLPHLEVVAFLDNDRSRWGTVVDGIPVCGPEPDLLRRIDVVAIASIHRRQIADQLLALGCGGRIVFDADALCRTGRLARTA